MGLLAFTILLPTVDPVSLALEVLPLIALFEFSVVLAAVLERRWTAAQSAPRPRRSRRGRLARAEPWGCSS